MLPLCGNLKKRKLKKEKQMNKHSPLIFTPIALITKRSFFIFQRTATSVELSWTSKQEQIYNLLLCFYIAVMLRIQTLK
jgi:hypothetical protein